MNTARSIAPSDKSAPAIPALKAKPIKLRDTLAPKQLEFNQPINAKGQQFIRQATRGRLKKSRLSSAFLLRGFIQFVVDTYMNENNLPFWKGKGNWICMSVLNA